MQAIVVRFVVNPHNTPKRVLDISPIYKQSTLSIMRGLKGYTRRTLILPHRMQIKGRKMKYSVYAWR